MRYLFDAYAWVEYLEGSKLGEKVRKIILGENEIFSLNLTIAEVVSKVKRKNGNAALAFEAISSNSKIVEISAPAAEKAGLLHAQTRKEIPNFGLVDALLITLARELEAKILTGDNHFKNFKEVTLLTQ